MNLEGFEHFNIVRYITCSLKLERDLQKQKYCVSKYRIYLICADYPRPWELGAGTYKSHPL